MQEVCIKAVEEDPSNLRPVPDHFRTQEMCDEAVSTKPASLAFVPDLFKTEQMCNPAAFFLFLSVLKLKACAMSQCGWNHFH